MFVSCATRKNKEGACVRGHEAPSGGRALGKAALRRACGDTRTAAGAGAGTPGLAAEARGDVRLDIPACMRGHAGRLSNPRVGTCESAPAKRAGTRLPGWRMRGDASAGQQGVRGHALLGAAGSCETRSAALPCARGRAAAVAFVRGGEDPRTSGKTSHGVWPCPCPRCESASMGGGWPWDPLGDGPYGMRPGSQGAAAWRSGRQAPYLRKRKGLMPA